jgi:hypothetical protein
MLGLSLCLASGSSGDGDSAPSAPVNITQPTVSYSVGTGFVGDIAQCDSGAWTDASTYDFQWKRNGSAIPGATFSTYNLTSDDAGYTLDCDVTATGPGGSTTVSSNSLSPLELFDIRFTTGPIITSGDGATPTTLTIASPGTWEVNPPQAEPTLSYSWRGNGGSVLGTDSIQTATDPGDYYLFLTLTPASGPSAQTESNHLSLS